MGRAVVRRPKLFLFDEPLSNLDARLRGRMRVELIELHRRLQTTSLYVTHDQAEAMTLGQKLVVLQEGRIHQVGTPREVYERPADPFVAGFIGSPPMNFLEGTVSTISRGRFLRAAGCSIPAPAEVPEADVLLGVRPEDLFPGPGPLSLEVHVVEDLGGDRFVYGEAAGVSLVYRADPAGAVPSPGESVPLSIRSGKEHWFVEGRRVKTPA
jgi:sn-glycerol 3-phosphate transport system ATP-binding protein